MPNLTERYNKIKQEILEKEYPHLNEPQREAVFQTEGPVLILAGAGSGKTTVLINRAGYLLKYGNAYHNTEMPMYLCEDDVDFLENYKNDPAPTEDDVERAVSLLKCDPPRAWQLMAITFTNKAAGELKQRLCNMLGDEAGNDVWAATFHSSCSRILRRHAERLGYTSHFTIYDADDQKRVVKGIMSDLGFDEKQLPIKSVIGEISRAKDSVQSCEEYAEQAGGDFRLSRIAKIYSAYQKKLRESDAMDFDDLLMNTVLLFENEPDVLETYHRRLKYIMVDEYQDTNHAQYRLIKLLSQGSGNLCVVGDDDQSIYKFRGATIENILSFNKHYPKAKIIRLEQNYRSTQNILDAANSVIKNNSGRHAKTLWTAQSGGEPIYLYDAENERGEAQYIAEKINDHVAKGGKYSDCAVLYRVNSLSATIENHFTRAAIPYRVVAGRKFYDRKEIRDAIAYLTVLNNPNDEVRLTRIINEPKRGIGDRSVEQAAEIAAGLGISLFEVMSTADQYSVLSRSANKMKQFCDMIEKYTEAAVAPDAELDTVLDELLEESGYMAALRADEKAEERVENIGELLSSLRRYQEENGDEATLQGFLEEVALVTDIDAYDEDADCATLMTLHAAKGLEFPVVFIPGAEEGLFPGMMSMLDVAELEEDRRLAYVGITRAKKVLHITHANARVVFGHTQMNRLSRYVEEIDQKLISRSGVKKATNLQSSDRGGRSSYTPQQQGFTRPGAAAQPRTELRSDITSSAPQKKSTSFKPGDRVLHRVFGEGTVLSASAMGSDILLEIDFDTAGKKKLMANYAGLKAVQ